MKKRDPRFLQLSSADPLKQRALDAQKVKADLKEAALRRAQEREEQAQAYQEQAWQRVDRIVLSDEESVEAETAEDGEEDADEEEEVEEEEEAVPDFWCPACEKQFQSEGAYANHEKSKKHIKLLKESVISLSALLGLTFKAD